MPLLRNSSGLDVNPKRLVDTFVLWAASFCTIVSWGGGEKENTALPQQRKARLQQDRAGVGRWAVGQQDRVLEGELEMWLLRA